MRNTKGSTNWCLISQILLDIKVMMMIKYYEERLQILAAGDFGSRAVLCPANYLQEFEAKLASFLWKIQRKGKRETLKRLWAGRTQLQKGFG